MDYCQKNKVVNCNISFSFKLSRITLYNDYIQKKMQLKLIVRTCLSRRDGVIT